MSSYRVDSGVEWTQLIDVTVCRIEDEELCLQFLHGAFYLARVVSRLDPSLTTGYALQLYAMPPATLRAGVNMPLVISAASDTSAVDQ